MSMAHSLEARVPFFDVDYISTAMAVNPAKKLIRKVSHRDLDQMELKVKGKFVTSIEVKNFQNSSCHIMEKINENYDKKLILGYHDPLKMYGAPKLCTVMQ